MEDQNIKFVGEVEKYPDLYDYTKSGYSRKNVVEKAWAEIGKKFNLTGNESKEKWRNLRNSFVKNLKPPANGASAKRKRTYYLSEAMQFTLPFVKVAGVTNNGSCSDLPIHVLTEPDLLLEEDSFIEDYKAPDQTEIHQPLPTSPHPSTSSSASPAPIYEEVGSFSHKRKRATEQNIDTDRNIGEYLLAKKKYMEVEQQVSGSDRSEAIKMFLMSLVPDLEALTPAQIRAFKLRTLALIEEFF